VFSTLDLLAEDNEDGRTATLVVKIGGSTGTSSVNLAQVGGAAIALGAAPAAASLPVTQGAGAANLATAQVATATSQVAAAIARPTRKSIVFQNLDAAITIYVGPTGITSSTGVPIPPGGGRSFTWAGQFFAVSASGTPVLSVSDEYD